MFGLAEIKRAPAAEIVAEHIRTDVVAVFAGYRISAFVLFHVLRVIITSLFAAIFVIAGVDTFLFRRVARTVQSYAVLDAGIGARRAAVGTGFVCVGALAAFAGQAVAVGAAVDFRRVFRTAFFIGEIIAVTSAFVVIDRIGGAHDAHPAARLTGA